MLTPTVPPPTDRLTALLTTFGLTTAAEEMVPRLTQAGHQAAVPVVVEVFDAEAEARRQRRIARLRRAARLPPGKTFETLVLPHAYHHCEPQLLPVSPAARLGTGRLTADSIAVSFRVTTPGDQSSAWPIADAVVGR